MHTATHGLVAAALFCRQGRQNRARNIAAVIGGIAPDSIMFAMVAWARFRHVPGYEVWGTWYFTPPWQTWIDAFHSLPIALLILVLGFVIGRSGGPVAGTAVAVFALAVISHIALDLPVHYGDAHAHFFPLSDWRYASPISYWNPAYHGALVRTIETAGDIALACFLWIRFRNPVGRGLAALALLSYAAPSIYFDVLINFG